MMRLRFSHNKTFSIAVYFNIKEHVKDNKIIFISKQFIAYLLEEHYRDHGDDQIVVLFDMQGAGLSNVVSFYLP